MRTNNSRIITICAFVVLVALVLGVRLFFVQVVQGARFKDQANRQYSAPQEGLYNRGSIYFKEKDGNLVSAANLKSGYIIAINPSMVDDPEVAFEKLNLLLADLDRQSFFAKVSQKDDPYEEIARRIPEQVAEKISSQKLPGVFVYQEKWRFYPGGPLASHVLGFVGFEGDDFLGRYGVEKYYNDILTKRKGGLYSNFFAEIFSNIKSKTSPIEADVVLTVEPTVQKFLEGTLDEATEKWNGEHAGGIIIDPYTGEIFALAVRPAFDPNNYGQELKLSIFSNTFVEKVYEMGSIIKPITVASGLDNKTITAETTYDDKGFVELNTRRIENYDGKARGVVPMQEVLNQSLNTGAVFVMQKMGKDIFREYMYKFGLAEKTDVDLPNEITGLTDNLESKKDIEYATASFGQGVAFTPIATARAMSVLANGGYLIKPHVTCLIDRGLGIKNEIKPVDQGKVISKEASQEITRMLVAVVDDALLGGTVKMDRYSIAAKTGTAQIANLEEGGYYDDRYLHSFFGYFPAYQPRFLVLLYLYHPKEVRFASHTLTHTFMDIVKFLISYYEVPPDR